MSTMQDKFGVKPLKNSPHEMMAALYLQVSIISQALIFVTRSRSWSYVERPGLLLACAFMIAQLVRINQHVKSMFLYNLFTYHQVLFYGGGWLLGYSKLKKMLALLHFYLWFCIHLSAFWL